MSVFVTAFVSEGSRNTKLEIGRRKGVLVFGHLIRSNRTKDRTVAQLTSMSVKSTARLS